MKKKTVYDEKRMAIMKQRSGQAALIVVLVVIVALTLAVGVAGRSVTTVSVSTQEQERARAFSAAEAGVEDALRQDLSKISSPQTINFTESSASYQVSKLPVATANVYPGEIVTIDWSKGTAPSVNVTFPGQCTQLEYTDIKANGTVNRTVVSDDVTISKPGPGNPLTRIRLIGCVAVPVPLAIAAAAGTTLSFYQVDSQGSSTLGTANSRVQVVRSEPAAPGIMDYAIFSGGNIQ